VTDARFPERWLNDRRIMRLSDSAFRLHVVAITWSVSNRTDGVIHDDDLCLIPTVDANFTDELEKASLWEHDADRWTIVGFAHTQTTAAQLEGLEHKRAVDRERQARHRAKVRDVTRDIAVDGMRDTKDRTGQDRQGLEDVSAHACDRCAQSPTKVDRAGAYYCRDCAPHLWKDSAA
jgi:hypothetical protein